MQKSFCKANRYENGERIYRGPQTWKVAFGGLQPTGTECGVILIFAFYNLIVVSVFLN